MATMAYLERQHHEDPTEPAAHGTSNRSKTATVERITIFTLPRELRQKIFFEALKLLLAQRFWLRGVYYDVLICHEIRFWCFTMMKVHDTLKDDVEYVAGLIGERFRALCPVEILDERVWKE